MIAQSEIEYFCVVLLGLGSEGWDGVSVIPGDLRDNLLLSQPASQSIITIDPTD